MVLVVSHSERNDEPFKKIMLAVGTRKFNKTLALLCD